MANHRGTDRHIAALKAKLTTTFLKGELCRSGLEAHVGDVLEHCGIEYAHEAVKFCMPNLPTGNSTPDFLIEDPFHPGGTLIIEPKGGDTTRGVATFREFVKRAASRHNGEGLDITGYMLAKYGFLKLYTDRKTGPAALYHCEDCGKYHFAHKEPAHLCPYCQATPDRIEYVTDKLNEYANLRNRELWEANWEAIEAVILADQEAYDKAKDYEKRLLRRLIQVKTEIGWEELVPGDNAQEPLHIQTPFAYEGMYIPDFYYEEMPNSIPLLGHAVPPLVLVSVSEQPSENDEIVFQHIHDWIVAGHEFVKHAVLSLEGFKVLDWTTDGEYKDGAIFTCPDCGKHYIAPYGAECPFCGSLNGKEYHKQTDGKAA